MSTDHRPLPLAAVTALMVLCSFTVVTGDRADAATIVASYERGRADVVVNGYGTTAMGTFRLRDGSDTHLALCIEADVPHSAATDAYGPVDRSVDSPRLDALLWWLDRQPAIDDDTAVAASALAWYYAGARRSFGPLVWSDGTRGFAPISPDDPASWDALAPFSLSHPIGLVVPGAHLDAAERRVAELHRVVARLSGTWSLDVDPGRDTIAVRLTVDGVPLTDRPIELRIEPADGGATIVRSVRSDADGRAAVDTPSDGYTVVATTDAPGAHREWDGAGPVQRLATPTTRVVSSSASRAPDDGHLVVRKVSTDPTIGVEGAVFDLVDADGDVVATARTAADGVARFVDVDRVAHPGPYTVRETEAPPGLIASTEPVVVEELGVDPARPPVVEVANRPATARVTVRKTLSVEEAGPADRSGFEFRLRRRADGAEHRLVTREDGTAGPLDLPLGSYEVCETSVPAWAARLVDTGCRSVEITLDSLDSTIEVTYVNDVPEPHVDTQASDPSDGDRILELHQTQVVDRVRLERLVAGTTYRVRGELVDAATGAPTGSVGWTEFTADDEAAEIEVLITVAEPAVGDWVVVESVYVGEVLVARHDDLLDTDQTVTVVAPPASTTTTTTTTTTPTTTTTTAPTSPTTTSTTTSTTPPVTAAPTTPATVARPPRPPATLPPTGSDAVTAALRLGDVGFVVGVGLFAIAGLVPTRRGSGRDEAGR